jgi:hypothetical protein
MPRPFARGYRGEALLFTGFIVGRVTHDKELVPALDDLRCERGSIACGRFGSEATAASMIASLRSRVMRLGIASLGRWASDIRHDPGPKSLQLFGIMG